MNKSLIAISLALASTASWGTYCQDGSTIESHPNNDCNFKEPKKNAIRVDVSPSADAQAKAAAKAKAEANIGDVTAAQQQKQKQKATGGSVVIEGNQAGSGDRSSFVAWAPVLHGPAAPALASANLVVLPGVCGPRVRVITTQIMGQHYGPMGGRYDEQRGYMETLGPWLDEDGNIGNPFIWRDGFMLGHVVTQYAAVVGTSSAASFSVGGFVDSKGLQGGAAGSGAAQQLVKSLQVAECLYAMPKQEPTVIYQTRTKTITKWRDRPVARPCCVVPPPCCTVQNSPPISLAK